ncbi:hypothetical protein SASPL_107444 [Salvia splendens]|uniref:Armadillo-like repeats domain-containing protein n=1 Tax=Salvia splendens TaxID=180675 RepID=A0A8X8YGV0_SALSN|nr:hypothetical protein SASPL_107444 [Salvia splendens]
MTTCNGSFCCSSSHTSIDSSISPFPKPLSLIPNRKPFALQFGPTLPLLTLSSAASRPLLEKALDLVEFTGSVTQTIPGPRVGQSSLPWMLAIPMAYLGVTFVIAVVKTVRNFYVMLFYFISMRILCLLECNCCVITVPAFGTTDDGYVNKNAMLCISLDELFAKGMGEVNQSALKELMQKTGFDMKEILRKYIRYVLNEKPFNPDLIANLIHLRKETQLEDSEVAGILNEISGRIVNDKGPVVMDISGYSEKGFKRKLAVQALFGKIYYLSELPEFCSRDSSLNVKTAFGVTDEDAEKLRLHTVSEVGDLDSLEKMVGESEEDEETKSSDDLAKAS